MSRGSIAPPARSRSTSSATEARTSRLIRPLQPMPPDVLRALTAAGLLAAYEARPAFQQNDYLGWISRAKKDATRQKRLEQMLEELERGDVYMKMAWRPRRTRA